MKTHIIILIIFAMFSAGASAGSYNWLLEEEQHIGDIPFDTEWIAITSGSVPAFLLEEEQYVDDIPFNTYDIMQEALLDKVEKESDEAYVNDIPFDTRKIYNDYQVEQLYAQYRDEREVADLEFSPERVIEQKYLEAKILPAYENEEPVYDIPFRTDQITFDHLLKEAMSGYLDEEGVEDLPFKTRTIYCQKFICPETETSPLSKDISSSKFRSIIELESMGYDFTRYLDELMDNIETIHISSSKEYEKKTFYLNNSFDAL